MLLFLSLLSITFCFLLVGLFVLVRKQSILLDQYQKELEEVKIKERSRDKNLKEEIDKIQNLLRHDLKGPFNRIFALSKLLTMPDSKLSREQSDYCKKIQETCAEGISMINKDVSPKKY